MINRLKAMHAAGENYSDVILRIAKADWVTTRPGAASGGRGRARGNSSCALHQKGR
jgi:hypothetical protein